MNSLQECHKNLDECHDGYYVCHSCKGSGKDHEYNTLICDVCWGTGILDWIERITGKEMPFAVSSSSISSSTSSSSSSI